jgi:peroxiredoxin
MLRSPLSRHRSQLTIARSTIYCNHVLEKMTAPRWFPSKKARAFIALASLIIVPIGFLLYFHEKWSIQPLPLGIKIPSSQISTLDGAPVVLDNYQGKKFLLMFFTIECAHCRTELANLNALYPKFNRTMDFFVVSLSSAEETKLFITDKRLSFQIFHQEKNVAKDTFRLVGVPAILLVDELRMLRQQYLGERREEEDEKLLQSFVVNP